MADRFDKFTERARRVLTYAKEEAQGLNHNYIGTEHLLLGILRERDGVAVKVLQSLGVDVKAREALLFVMGRGEKPVTGEIGLTPRAIKVIELAVKEARRMRQSYVATEHLLLGLIDEGEGLAYGVLESLGVTRDVLREATDKLLSEAVPVSLSSAGPQQQPKADPTREQAARIALNSAIAGLGELTGAGMERELLETMLRPLLVSLIEDIDRLSAVEGYAEARWSIERALPSLAATAGVLQRHGQAAFAEKLTTAMVAVMNVLAP
ncbi:MAG TPA: Clp protease N-terminal domain-containing protein [Dehalococcoidia bacterium]|nr:Clp protease N-terminal domain-containing protein [Dehalococcoidia bacterium]